MSIGDYGKRSIMGSGESMPVDMLLRKQERTCMYESPTMVDDFHRSTLKDITPDARLFEYEQHRGGTDSDGTPFGNNISSRFLSFRNSGFMDEQDAEPNLPDGTFLDHVFTELDPRGVALEPDMRKHADQQFSRGSFYNYRSDADDSVPESGVNPWIMQMNIRNAQGITKDYQKNFSTSRDNFHNGGMAPGYAISTKEKLVEGQEIKDPVQDPNRNKIDATTVLSNKTMIGWRRTTDHVFKVAKYGRKNIGKSFTDTDWYKNRANSSIDHDILVSWQDNNMSKTTALKMMDLAKQKFDAHYTGLHGINWGKIRESQSTKHKLTPADMSGMAKRPTKETQGPTAHDTLKGDMAPTSGEKLLLHDAPTISKTNINTTIFEKMGQATKKTVKHKKDDLRNAIEKTAKQEGLFMEENNKKKKKKSFDPSILWDSITVFRKGDEKAVANYKTIKKTKGHNLDRIVKHQFERDSYARGQNNGLQRKNVVHKSKEARHDNDFGQEGVHTRHIGGMQSKYMNTYMDREDSSNVINDNEMYRSKAY